MTARLEWRDYQYFAYERDFARLEAEQIFNAPVHVDALGVSIPSSAFQPTGADRLTYFARAIPSAGAIVVPRQARLEATAVSSSSKQATRYSAHSLHEYRGRFNPQVVRAIANIVGVPEGGCVLDPFCGSGTTLLECAHAGWSSLGVDRNPLAVQIANSKLHALRRAEPILDKLSLIASALGHFETLSSTDRTDPAEIEALLGNKWEDDVPSFQYMAQWFVGPVLAQIVAIRRVLATIVKSDADRSVFEIVLSDTLRGVSLQEPLDLRIRRRKVSADNYPLIDTFIKTADDRLSRILRAREELGDVVGAQLAVLGDNRKIDYRSLGLAPLGFDAVITSPPYETALPYIDTQRLSLILLGHIKADEVSATEQQLIGARDISTRERRELEGLMRSADDSLPKDVIDLCRDLLSSASGPENGFRRRNRPALVYRYFRSMAEFFENLRGAVRPGGKVALVVGPSRTTLNGREFIIDTPRLLLAIAARSSFAECFSLPMETYQRYDMHQRNSIQSETLLVLEPVP